MKQFKYLICIMLSFFFVALADVNAQSARWIVKGTVIDTDELPVIGASVAIKTAQGRFVNRATTDMDGNYMIEVTIKDPILSIAYMGFKTAEIKLKEGETVKDVTIEPDVKVLEGVTVTEKENVKTNDGFTLQDKRNLATSTTNVKLDDIAKSPATTVGEMIQGRASGVQIVASSGDPGAGYTVRIRGNSSINGSNDPLVVIDGVPYEISLGGANINDLTSSHSPLSMVNPADIASIDILKDAASCAIYGAKGGNGVLVITTKRGNKNEKVVNFNSTLSIRQASTEIPLLDGNGQKTFILEGDQHYRDASSSTGGSATMENLTYRQLRDDPTRDDYWYYNNNTDWVDLVTQTGYQWDNNFALRGGGNTTRYSFSVGYTTDQGTTIGGSYDRFTSNFNLDYNIADNLTFKTSIGYTRSVTGRDGQLNVYGMTPLSLARQYPAFLSVYEKDGMGNNLDGYYIPRPEHDNEIYSKTMYNPLAWTKYTNRELVNNSFRSNVSIDWEMLKGLKLTSRVAVDFSNDGDEEFVPSEATNRDWNDGVVNRTRKYSGNSQFINQENLLTYSLDLEEMHSLNAQVATKIRYNSGSTIDLSATNTGSPNAAGVDASNRWTGLGSSESRSAAVELLGQFYYRLMDRYIVQGTVNRVGSTKFGPDKRWGTFPTVAVAYRISSEPFMQSWASSFLSDMKLRYSIGEVGREPSASYLYVSTYSQSGSYLGEYGISSNGIQLNTLKWETTRTHNFAVDMGLFNDRITFTAEYYDKMTYDLFYQFPLPSTSGYSSIWKNFGELSNKGFELEFNARVLDDKLKWDLYGNVATNVNKITNWDEDFIQNEDGQINWAAGSSTTGYPSLVREGDPLGSFYGFKFKGVYAQDADAVAKDKDGNVIVDLNARPKNITWERGYSYTGGDAIYQDLNYDGMINNRDRTIIGNANPDFYGGVGTKLSWKNWNLNMFFQYQVGNDIINQARKDLESESGGTNANINQAQSVLRRWRKQGDVTDIPRVIFSENYSNAGSDKYVEDGSYVRLKSIALGYEIPRDLCKKIGMRSASVTLNAYNVLTFTNYKGQDPEISIGGTLSTIGVDNNRTAVPRSYTMSLALTF